MDKILGMSYIWGDSAPHVHGYFLNGVKNLPQQEQSGVIRRFLQIWCETCALEDNCPLLFNIFCNQPVEEWKVMGCFPFCDNYEPKGGEGNAHQ